MLNLERVGLIGWFFYPGLVVELHRRASTILPNQGMTQKSINGLFLIALPGFPGINNYSNSYSGFLPGFTGHSLSHSRIARFEPLESYNPLISQSIPSTPIT